MNKYLMFTVISLFSIFAMFPFQTSQAAGMSSPFGGRVLFSINCSCSSGDWLFMSPLYTGSGSTPGALIYDQASIKKVYARGTMGSKPSMMTWLLGHYEQSSSDCEIEAGEDCITLPALGKIVDYGSNR